VNHVSAKWIPARIFVTIAKSAQRMSPVATLASALSAPSSAALVIAATKNAAFPPATAARPALQAVNRASAQ